MWQVGSGNPKGIEEMPEGEKPIMHQSTKEFMLQQSAAKAHIQNLREVLAQDVEEVFGMSNEHSKEEIGHAGSRFITRPWAFLNYSL